MKRLAIAIDPSYVSKAGSKTDSSTIYTTGHAQGNADVPRTLDGKINFRNPDRDRMKRLDIDSKEGEAYELVAWSKSLRQKVRLVIHYPGNIPVRLFQSARLNH